MSNSDVRVLLVTNSLANGGLERQLSLLARSLPDRFERRIWSMEGGPHVDAVTAAGIPLYVRPRRFRFDVGPAIDLWRLVRAWRPHIVHAWHWMPAAAAVPACSLLGVPLVDGSIRMGSVPRERGRPRRGIMRFATVVVANTRAGLSAWGIDPPKGRVIHNGFESARLAAAGLAGPARDDLRRFTVVMTARMDPPKDYVTVLQAARLLAASDPGGWRFVLVGDGSDRRALLARAGGLVMQGAVSFPEGGTETLGHLLRADAGVLLSDPAILAEGCPNSIMEYMACGLPVVCADSGGCKELVRDGETGWVIAPRDPAALAKTLERLRDDPGRAAAMGAAGRDRIVTEFSIEKFVASHVALYDELAGLGTKGRQWA